MTSRPRARRAGEAPVGVLPGAEPQRGRGAEQQEAEAQGEHPSVLGGDGRDHGPDRRRDGRRHGAARPALGRRLAGARRRARRAPAPRAAPATSRTAAVRRASRHPRHASARSPGTASPRAARMIWSRGGLDAAREVVRAEPRLRVVLDDAGGADVRQRALEAVADLDAHLPVVDEHEEDGAVVLVLLADAPGLERGRRVLLDRGARRQPPVDEDEHLVRGLALELRERLVQRRQARRVDDARAVGRVAVGTGRDLDRRLRGGGEREQREGSQADRGHLSASRRTARPRRAPG